MGSSLAKADCGAMDVGITICVGRKLVQRATVSVSVLEAQPRPEPIATGVIPRNTRFVHFPAGKCEAQTVQARTSTSRSAKLFIETSLRFALETPGRVAPFRGSSVSEPSHRTHRWA